MPRNLAALLAEDGAAPADAVERALARQREAGGALDTALLEVGAISEDLLVPLLARAAGVPPAPEAAWSAADARARRVFPSRVAERHGLAPFALDGRELSLVATYPVDVALLDEISFMLSLHLTAHVGPEWRVRELIHRIYGSPLPPRLAALASRSGAPVYAPSNAPGSIAELPAPEEPPPPPPPTGFERDESEPLEPLAAALEQALDDIELPVEEEPRPEPPEPAAAAAEPERPRPPPDRAAPPRWTLDEARAALAAARDRDEVVLAALRYARDFFEFAAIFAVTRDAIAGHDALGSDDARERARAVAIWAADAGMLRTVLETRSPYLGPVSPDVPSNQAVLSGLGRDTPRTALVCPVILRDRPVCVLYADNGEAPVSARRLGDLLLFLSTIGAALERIIRDRKERPRRRAPAASPPPPAGSGGAAGAPAAAPAAASAEGAPGAVRGADGSAAPPPDSPGSEVAAHSPEPQQPAAADVEVTVSEPSQEARAATPEQEPAPADASGAPPEPTAPEAPAAGASEPAQPGAPDAIAAAVASFDVEVEVDGRGSPAQAAPAPAEPEVRPPEPDRPSPAETEGRPAEPDRAMPAAEAPAVADASPASAWRRTPPAESLDDIERQFFGVTDPWRTPAAAPGTPLERRETPPADEPQQAPAQAAAQPEEPAATEAPDPPAAPAPAAEPPAIEAAPAPATPAPSAAAEAPAPPDREQPAPPPAEARAAITPAPLHEPLPVPVEPARPAPTPAPERPATPVALADRALDADPTVAAAACEALSSRRRDPTLRPAHEKLRRALLSGISSRATRAAHALEALRDVEAIPLLVQVLETSEPETAGAAASALASITLQRIGTDARKWLAWWKQNRGRGRAEWLFSGLTSADRETRVLAEAELRQAGDAPVEYSPDMSAPDRERAARAWAGWLARSGHVL